MESLLGLSARQPKKPLIDGSQIKLTKASTILSSLRPILRMDSGNKGAIQLLLKSVYDFLTSCASHPIWVNISAQNSILAIQCLQLMNCHLKYDICNIGDRSLLNAEVEGLTALVRKCIPEALQYACLFFVYHVKDALTSQPVGGGTPQVYYL